MSDNEPKDKINKISEYIKKYQKEANDDYHKQMAKYVTNIKIIGYAIKNIPKAYKMKKEYEKSVFQEENTLYKKKGILDFIETDEIDYDSEVEKSKKKIDNMYDKANEIKKKSNLFYWIKTIFIKIRNYKQPKLPKETIKNVEMETTKIDTKEKFLQDLRKNVNLKSNEEQKYKSNEKENEIEK